MICARNFRLILTGTSRTAFSITRKGCLWGGYCFQSLWVILLHQHQCDTTSICLAWTVYVGFVLKDQGPEVLLWRFWGCSCFDSSLSLSLRSPSLQWSWERESSSSINSRCPYFQLFQFSLQIQFLASEGANRAHQLSANSKLGHSQLPQPFSWSTRYTLLSLFWNSLPFLMCCILCI